MRSQRGDSAPSVLLYTEAERENGWDPGAGNAGRSLIDLMTASSGNVKCPNYAMLLKCYRTIRRHRTVKSVLTGQASMVSLYMYVNKLKTHIYSDYCKSSGRLVSLVVIVVTQPLFSFDACLVSSRLNWEMMESTRFESLQGQPVRDYRKYDQMYHYH